MRCRINQGAARARRPAVVGRGLSEGLGRTWRCTSVEQPGACDKAQRVARLHFDLICAARERPGLVYGGRWSPRLLTGQYGSADFMKRQSCCEAALKKNSNADFCLVPVHDHRLKRRIVKLSMFNFVSWAS